ncbi:MAG TPA: hypothetical protein VN256_08840 [Pyrinomonadaceae bacterium]|nr:hypothetical protein [Pyrinomonadaceae bacterium]
MKTIAKTRSRGATLFFALARLIAVLAISCAVYTQALAQTPADTPIENTATATYGDGSGGTYTATSNKVTVTVSKVSGLTITPDVTNGSSDPTVVPGQAGATFTFTVTNTGNFTDQVRFLAGGASIQIASGMATVASAYVEMNNVAGYQAGQDVDIADGVADLVNFTQGQSRSVVVLVNVNAAAPAGSIINVRLGDADDAAPYDNEPVDGTVANEVRTESNASVNGRREARGDRSATVENDAQLTLSLTAPAGPVPLASDITYVWQLCNTGSRNASAVTLTNAPAGSQTGVFVFAPVPTGTTLKSPQVFPAGTLYSASPVTDNPITTATWVAVAPPNTTRVAFNVGATLAPGAPNCSANLNMLVTITTADATNPVTEQGTAYANNSVTAEITATSPLRTTLLQIIGLVLNGPQGAPGASNSNTNDDFTNKSVSAGLAGVGPGGSTTAQGVVNFTNTIQNSGNANDSYTLSVQSFPAGATVKVTVNAVQTTVVNNGVATGNAIPAIPINFGATADYQVEVTLPAGKTVLTGYDTVLRATSGNTNTEYNETIDRVYTGFIELTKTATVSNTTGVGAATDPVPGAQIIYTITYKNVSSEPAGGAGNVTLSASNIVISEDGTPSPGNTNNWATYTTMVLGPPAAWNPSDTLGGNITDGSTNGAVTAATNFLKDTIAGPLGPQQQGTFTFRRLIN